MTLSMNEVEAMAKKATRGAGYSWGMAEEAGRATRWLCERGIDGCSALADLLCQRENTPVGEWFPFPVKRCRPENDNPLCPITTGAALSDWAHELDTKEIACYNVLQPILLLPFVATIAQRRHNLTAIKCGEAQASTDGNGVALTGSFPDQAARVAVTPSSTFAKTQNHHQRIALLLGHFY